MITEVARLTIKPALVDEFESSFQQAQKIIMSMSGYIRHTLHKNADKDNQYLLQVEWRSREDHIQGFRQSDEYQQWRKLLHQYYDPFPDVEYFSSVFIENKAS